MVAIGRGLMSRPDVLAIDEMSLGLAPIVVRRLARLLTRLNRQDGLARASRGAERAARVSLCTRGYVMETGGIVASGTTAGLAHSPTVRDAFLGSVVTDGQVDGVGEAAL